MTEVVGVGGSRVLIERYLPLHDTVFKTVSCSGMIFPGWSPRNRSITLAVCVNNEVSCIRAVSATKRSGS